LKDYHPLVKRCIFQFHSHRKHCIFLRHLSFFLLLVIYIHIYIYIYINLSPYLHKAEEHKDLSQADSHTPQTVLHILELLCSCR
jgi:hypothetical protein